MQIWTYIARERERENEIEKQIQRRNTHRGDGNRRCRLHNSRGSGCIHGSQTAHCNATPADCTDNYTQHEDTNRQANVEPIPVGSLYGEEGKNQHINHEVINNKHTPPL